MSPAGRPIAVGPITMAIAAIALVAIAATGVALSAVNTPGLGADASTPGGVSTSSPTSSPTPSSASTAVTGPNGPDTPPVPAFDPVFGDTVVANVAADLGAGFANGVTARIVSVTQTTITGEGVGSSNGPGVAVEIELTNTSGSPVDVDAVTVSAYSGAERVPGTLTIEGSPFAGILDAGAAARGRYTFGVDSAGDSLAIAVGLSADSGLVVLQYG